MAPALVYTVLGLALISIIVDLVLLLRFGKKETPRWRYIVANAALMVLCLVIIRFIFTKEPL